MTARLLTVALPVLLTTVLAGVPAGAAAEPTRFGVIASTQGSVADTFEEQVRLYEEHRRAYGAPIGIRIFSQPLPLPTDRNQAGRLLDWAAREHPGELITVSHKTRDDARLRRLLDWVRTTGVRLSVIYRHEPQPDWFAHGQRDAEPEVYRATYRAYRAVIAAHPARAKVTLEKNLMWFWQHRHVPANPLSDWRHYVETDDPADLLSWDVYAFPGLPADRGNYGDPDLYFRYARAAWREFRLPWAVGEIGSSVQDGTGRCAERSWDRDGTRFAAWVVRMTDAARAPAGMPPARFVKWWGALDAADCDLSLEQVPAAAAHYRTLVRQRPL